MSLTAYQKETVVELWYRGLTPHQIYCQMRTVVQNKQDIYRLLEKIKSHGKGEEP